ncbi:MAG: hypothetical protein KBB95_10525 [Deltaproteobacteria bacterium]|nr:hypothetical protein [Deltaproteobacteria bacterium]
MSARPLPLLPALVIATALAEALGLVVARALSVLVANAAIEPGTTAASFLPLLGVVGGLLEGLMLGVAQGVVLARHGYTNVRSFALASTLGMGIAWSLVMVLAALEPAVPTSPGLDLLVAMLAGGGLGAILGLLQRRVLSPVPGRFALHSALGWCAGLVATLFVEQFVPTAASDGYSFAASALGGALTGAIVGLVVGGAFPRTRLVAPDVA